MWGPDPMILGRIFCSCDYPSFCGLPPSHVGLNCITSLDSFFMSVIVEMFSTSFLKIYLFLAVLDLHCCVLAFSSCSERELLCLMVYMRPLFGAPFVAERRL